MVRYIWAPYRALERYLEWEKSTARGLQLLRVQTEEVVHLISTIIIIIILPLVGLTKRYRCDQPFGCWWGFTDWSEYSSGGQTRRGSCQDWFSNDGCLISLNHVQSIATRIVTKWRGSSTSSQLDPYIIYPVSTSHMFFNYSLTLWHFNQMFHMFPSCAWQKRQKHSRFEPQGDSFQRNTMPTEQHHAMIFDGSSGLRLLGKHHER